MRTEGTAGEKEIQTTGFFVFGALTLIVALLKLAVFSDWSWWRVSLPILIFVGFNITYVVAGFGYLSFGCRSYIYNGVNNLQAHYRWYVTDCF